jgi:hypothetical protein
MPDSVELSSDVLDKIKQGFNQFKGTLDGYVKDNNIEIKDWKFAVQSSESVYTIDAAFKIQIKPKAKDKK